MVETCARGGNVFEHVVKRKGRDLKLQSAGDGEVGPVLDVGECAEQLFKNFLTHFGAEFFAGEVGEEGIDVVSHDGEASFDIGNTLDVLSFGFL